MHPYPKRLIEVDLPIRRISAHARREKSIRHGHISTLHIWWARRPLAACRAVILAALWPDPADPGCPQRFRDEARTALLGARNTVVNVPSGLSVPAYDREFATDLDVRAGLLDFIAEFANWDNSTVPDYLAFARHLVQVAHEALGGEPGTRPLVVDPFAGGGSIPLEALRVGADAFASDLNPVAVLLNKVVLEYIPKYGQRLADEVRKWGAWVKEQAEKELAEFYPKDPDGATPVAYLWARTVRCEGPSCGSEIPLIRTMWLARKGERNIALRLVPDRTARGVTFQLVVRRGDRWFDKNNQNVEVVEPSFEGTVKRGAATCPLCNYTTPIARIRDQMRSRRGGARDARLFAVVVARTGDECRDYRLPVDRDIKAAQAAEAELERRKSNHSQIISLVPDEPTPKGGGRGAGRAFSQRLYGMDTFGDLFVPRQLLTLTTLARLVREAGVRSQNELGNGLGDAVTVVLGLCCSKLADLLNSLCGWQPSNDRATHLFARQAIQITWDFAESTGANDAVGNFGVSIANISRILDREAGRLSYKEGHVERASALSHPLPDDSADALFTDPPYYDAVPYADLSDFFYVWLHRSLRNLEQMPSDPVTPKDGECIVDDAKGQDTAYFERGMSTAMAEARRFVKAEGVGIVVFAHKSTVGWESQLQAMIDAGWIITGSWPIDTEWATRLRAMNSAALASSVHLVCRPRENPDGSHRTTEVGEWRDVLDELPVRIREWMPRLDAEGVSGADAIFACLGPALEIFSRYSRVERADGTPVTLREYLEQVWAAVAKEALGLVFEGGDASGLEADARLTAMWLWTLRASAKGPPTAMGDDEMADGSADDEDEEAPKAKAAKGGFSLEFDAAIKIARGLGAHLEKLGSVVEVKGPTARLLPVAERERHLIDRANAGAASGGAAGAESPAAKSGKGKKGHKPAKGQTGFGEAEDGSFTAQPGAAVGPNGGSAADLGGEITYTPGATTLDRVHQAMLMFGRGRSESLARFLKEDGAGADPRFWRLAQSLSALYPTGTDEKRWVDGVLARKKGLGF